MAAARLCNSFFAHTPERMTQNTRTRLMYIHSMCGVLHRRVQRQQGWRYQRRLMHASANPYIPTFSSCEVRRKYGNERGLFASHAIAEGDIVLSERPIAAMGGPASSNTYCPTCFRSVTHSQSPVTCSRCGSATYCCSECQALGAEIHDMVCGETALDEYCETTHQNFPRMAADMIRRSLAAGDAFEQYWGAVNTLHTPAIASQPDLFNDHQYHYWIESYALVKQTFQRAMSTGHDALFTHVFDIKTYAKLMGILHLNSFALQSPLQADGMTGSATMYAGDTGAGSTNTAARRHGTALYITASMTNHSCGA